MYKSSLSGGTMRHSVKAWITFCALLAAAAPIAACGGDDDGGGGGVDCTSTPVPTFSQVSAFSQVCTECHSTENVDDERNGAPLGINFDDITSAREHAAHAAEEVEEGHMPPPGSGLSITDEQREQIVRW